MPPVQVIAKPVKHNTSRSAKAGINFPVGRIHRLLKNKATRGRNMDGKLRFGRVSGLSALYMASILEYLCTELLELSTEMSKKFKIKRITPQIINYTIKADDEMNKLFDAVTLVASGIVPNYNERLLTLSAKDYFQQKRMDEKDAKKAF